MAVGAPANLRLYEDALRWFRSRTALTPSEFEKLDLAARRKAFSIAGVTQLGMVQSVFDDIERSIAAGESYDQFRKRVRLKLLRAWGKSKPYRIEAIFRTEIQKSYQAGRWKQLRTQAVRNLRPFWIFDAILDSRTSAVCRAHDGTIRHLDDPYWFENYPPLHVNCRSGVRSLRRSDVAKRGGPSLQLPNVPPQSGFGDAPTEEGEERPMPSGLGNLDVGLQAAFAVKQSQGT